MEPSNPTKECPLCGERMRRKDLELVDFIPGTSEKKRKKLSEWVCPECDYFEELEKDEEGRLANPGLPTGHQG